MPETTGETLTCGDLAEAIRKGREATIRKRARKAVLDEVRDWAEESKSGWLSVDEITGKCYEIEERYNRA